MPTVLERPRPRPLQAARAGTAALWLGTIAALAVLATVVHPVLATPPHVDRLVVENPNAWPVTVDVRRAGSGGWLPVATVPPDDAVRVDEVLDQGDRWDVRFRAAARATRGVTVERSALERGGWRITIP